MLRTSFIAAALALAASIAVAEAPATAMKRVRIDYRDLDLSRAADAHALIQRISLATAIACGGPAPRVKSASELRAFHACHHAATDQVVAATRAPLVLALHQGQANPIAMARR